MFFLFFEHQVLVAPALFLGPYLMRLRVWLWLLVEVLQWHPIGHHYSLQLASKASQMILEEVPLLNPRGHPHHYVISMA
jgi:hypothetical protein